MQDRANLDHPGMRIVARRLGALLGFACLSVMTARAGVELQVGKAGDAAGKSSPEEVYYAQDEMMRIDKLDDAGSVTQIELVRDGVVWEIDPRGKTYTRIDQSALKNFSSNANQRLQDTLSNLPPEKRALMQARVDQVQSQGYSYTDAGRNDHAGQYACHIWNEEHGSRRIAEYCVVSTSSLPGGGELAASMKAALVTVETITSGMPLLEKNAEHFTRLEKMNGFPVRTRRLSTSGQPESEHVLTSAEAHPLPADKFAVPRDFTEKPLENPQSD